MAPYKECKLPGSFLSALPLTRMTQAIYIPYKECKLPGSFLSTAMLTRMTQAIYIPYKEPPNYLGKQILLSLFLERDSGARGTKWFT